MLALSSSVGCVILGHDAEYLCDACEGATDLPPEPTVACTADTDCMMLPARNYDTSCTCADDNDSDPAETFGCVNYGAAKCTAGACVWPTTLDEEHSCPTT